MSIPPVPPGRADAKYSSVASQEIVGPPSLAVLLTFGTSSGIDQRSRALSRVEYQRSRDGLPSPPGRSLERIISRPSRRRIAVRVSRYGVVLNSSTRVIFVQVPSSL